MNLAGDLQRGIAELGITLDGKAQDKLLDYLALLHKWNKVYNLTAVRDQQRMVSHHLLDSLAVMPHLWAGRWLDVGCGAGLPGLVLAIAQPDWQFVLLDSNSKKASFVQQVVIELDLHNVSVHCRRVEEWQTTAKFDGIISRAFSELGELLLSTRHLIAPHGRWAAMKGEPEQELDRVPENCVVECVIRLQVPELHAARSLVIVGMRGSTIQRGRAEWIKTENSRCSETEPEFKGVDT